jgi:hypothetical protein
MWYKKIHRPFLVPAKLISFKYEIWHMIYKKNPSSYCDFKNIHLILMHRKQILSKTLFPIKKIVPEKRFFWAILIWVNSWLVRSNVHIKDRVFNTPFDLQRNIGWRNSFLGIDSWAPKTFTNTGFGRQNHWSLLFNLSNTRQVFYWSKWIRLRCSRNGPQYLFNFLGVCLDGHR